MVETFLKLIKELELLDVIFDLRKTFLITMKTQSREFDAGKFLGGKVTIKIVFDEESL